MMKPPTFFIFILLVLSHYRESCGARPLIRPTEKEIVINAGDSIYFECVHLHKIFFFFPEYNDEDGQKTVSSKPRKRTYEGVGSYKYIFSRRNAAPTDTGWYGCADHNETIRPKVFDDPEFSWIYFYVSWPDHLLVNENSHNKVIEVVAGRAAFLPCRPTSPDLKVDLYNAKTGRKVKVVGTIWYDAKFGFKFCYVDEKHANTYVCKTTMNGNEQHEDSYTFNIITSNVTNSSPTIDVNAPKYITRGQNLHLKCAINLNPARAPRFDWSTPFESLRISRKKHFVMLSEKDIEAFVELIIRNVTMEDEGAYRCYFKNSGIYIDTLTHITIVD